MTANEFVEVLRRVIADGAEAGLERPQMIAALRSHVQAMQQAMKAASDPQRLASDWRPSL
jgi:hypothetical protein